MISFKNHRGQEAEMKNIKYLVTVFFGSAIVALLIGQSFGYPPLAEPQTEQELIALHSQLIESVMKQNTLAAARLVADDAIVTTPLGQVVNKAQRIEGLKQIKVDSYVPDDYKIRIYGDTAVMTYHFAFKGTALGRDMSGDYRETVVWVKRNGQWQVVAAHGTAIAK